MTEKNYLCKCNMCDVSYIDTNPQTDAVIQFIKNDTLELVDHKCPKCGVDDYLTDLPID